MSEELLISQCSPTLAGIKTGSLFLSPLSGKGDMTKTLKKLNKRFVNCGIRILPLKYYSDKALIYMYRPKKLEKDLENTAAKNILIKRNYPVKNADLCVAELAKRLCVNDEFPHEIGLFLGYPPKDVEGFITLGGSGAKYTGVWKVYEDEESAKRTFAKYRKCTEQYKLAFKAHNNFGRLIVRS